MLCNAKSKSHDYATDCFRRSCIYIKNKKFSKEEIKNRAEEALKICGLYPFRNWPIQALSYGQKKRLTIATVLTINPKIIILDEPTAGQDYYHYKQFMSFIRNLKKESHLFLSRTI